MFGYANSMSRKVVMRYLLFMNIEETSGIDGTASFFGIEVNFRERHMFGMRDLTPVSYTHLTLPTIYSV